MEQLSTEGFLFKGQRIRVFAPICTADAPARPKVRNTKQFNGKYGCDWCLHPGTQVIRGKGQARAYPFQEFSEERTHHGMEMLAVEAVEKKTSQFGIKGPSILSSVTHIDLVNGFVPDFLHCALLGVARKLASLWFDSVNHESPWYIGQPTKQIKYDDMLKGVVVPKEIRRLPRSLTTREHWKGNEYKTFVLYYSLILLQDFLPVAFLNHYFLFVWSLQKLLGTSITSVELIKVKAALDYFVVKMEELYGVSNCTFNVHQLSHLAKSTQMCGPLWAVSTFIFENNNSTLKKMIQGTQYIPDQVCHTYSIMKSMPMFMKQNVEESDLVNDILQKLVFGKTETKRAVKLADNLLALGKAKVRKLSDEESVAIRARSSDRVNALVYEYNRFVWDGKLYDTAEYHRSTKRQNCFIKANCEGNTLYYRINGLVTLKQCSCEIQHHEQCNCQKHNVLLCMPYNIIDNHLYRCAQFNIVSDFISEVSALQHAVVTVPLLCVLTKCIKIDYRKKVFLIDMPNMIEME